MEGGAGEHRAHLPPPSTEHDQAFISSSRRLATLNVANRNLVPLAMTQEMRTGFELRPVALKPANVVRHTASPRSGRDAKTRRELARGDM